MKRVQIMGADSYVIPVPSVEVIAQILTYIIDIQ